jgi:S-sulfosulfanyl-L-cysteine sulfohydrolase
MSLSRRDYLQVLAAASAAGLPLASFAQQHHFDGLYDIPKSGNVHLLHFTDCHAQLLPIHFREPSVNIGIGTMHGRPPHFVGEAFLKFHGVAPNTAAAHAMTYLDFESAAQTFGKVGGFAHMATLVKQMKASRPNALLLDGGDTWQGSGTALWTNGQDMVDACLALGVDVMTAHWEMTLGEKRVSEVVENDFAASAGKAGVEFLAQNIRTTDFDDEVFKPYTIRTMNGIQVAIIGQAFPYTPIANPRHLVANWSFGIQEARLQGYVNEVRAKGVQAVVLLSHNGMDVDLKLASRTRGIDVILGGHTHDGVPQPVKITNLDGGITHVTNAGSNTKFLAVIDLDVQGNQVVNVDYKLLPVFANALPADPAMQALIDKSRAPFAAKLAQPLAVTQGSLYRRGNFNGTFDQLMLDALMQEKNAQIAFSPGFRWGTSLLAGQTITTEHVMDQTAISYPHTTRSVMSGEMIKTILEDVADNLFNPDPYLQQGGDMVRVGGLQYAIEPTASMGSRISEMRLDGSLIDPSKTYTVAGWAPVAQAGNASSVWGEPMWDLLSRWLTTQQTVAPRALNVPRIIGLGSNPGLAL